MLRRLLRATAAIPLLVLGLSGTAFAQAWPSKPIQWVVPYPPGGPSDVLARLLGQKLSERLGQQVMISNKPGAGGNIGTDFAAKSPPDGYTIVLGNPGPIAVNSSLYANLPYDVERDLAPITLLVDYPSIILVNPAFPAKSVKALIQLAKAQSKPLSYATAGVGTSQHLTGELFTSNAGIQMSHVAYKGSAPALTDVVGGHISIMIDALAAPSLSLIKSGKLYAIAVTSPERTPFLPDVPTVAESGLPGFAVTGWIGVMAPKGVPAPVMARLVEEFSIILQMPDVKAKITEWNARITTFGPEHFANFIRSETQKWGKVVRTANLKAQ